ncbi:response regulator [Pseudanabaena biceps]|nr:response regulator [Pseudanabaena biceps]
MTRQLLGGFSIPLVTVGFLTLWINYSLIQIDVSKQVQKRAQSIARALEFGTEGLIENGNTLILQRMVQNYETLPTVIEIDIIAPDGNSIIDKRITSNRENHTYKKFYATVLPYLEKATQDGLEATLETTINNKPAILYILPFSSTLFKNIDPQYQNKRGLVIAAIDLQQSQQEAWEIFLTTTVVMVTGSLVISSVMLGLIQVYALRPLNIITKAINASKNRGNIELRESLPNNEISYLADTLITAIAQIQNFEKAKNEELRKINNELAQLSESLELKVIERTAELTNMNTELEVAKEDALDASKAKSLFLANMSHELRTPLNAILGFAQLIIETDDIPEETREQLGIIRNSGEHLLSLINNILIMSRIESNKQSLSLNVFNLSEFLVNVQQIIAFKIREKNLCLLIDNQLDLDSFIKADELKLRQVLINLLNNAIKYTHSGSVTLRIIPDRLNVDYSQDPIGISQTKERTLFFEVEDTGIGISSEDLDNIFQPFFQSNSDRQYREGTGLGLSISKQFINLMGGDISVSSQLEVGTNFKFYISVNYVLNQSLESLKTEATVPQVPRQSSQLKILLAEDNLFNQVITIKMLERLGYSADVVNNGIEALEKLEVQNYDVILMDIQMPKMDGLEATRRILNNSSFKQKPIIIALTANVMEEDRETCFAAGMCQFIGKPVKIEILQGALEQVVSSIT